MTAARTIQWQDYGHFVLRIVEGELSNELGLALAHPIHFWLGVLLAAILPTEPAHAVALVSALAGAITVANVYGCCWSLTRRFDAALVAALGLALSNTFWRMSTMPECYTVTTALLSAELWCLALYCKALRMETRSPGFFVTAMFFNGLGLSNHNLALLTLPIFGFLLLKGLIDRRLRLWHALQASLAWGAGALPYLVLVGMQATRSGNVSASIHSALFGNHYAGNVLNASPSLKLIGISTAFTVLSFFNLTLPLALLGISSLLRDRSQRLLGMAFSAALVIHLLFVLRYNVIDQHTFLLPTYTLLALFAGIGFASLVARLSKAGTRRLFVVTVFLTLMAPCVYLAAASLARSQDALGNLARNKPYRDDYRYLLVPWGVGEMSADQMADHALRLSGETGVVVVGDSMARFAVAYLAHQRGMAGVEVHVYGRLAGLPWSDWLGRAVVWVPANTQSEEMPEYPAAYRLTPDPPLYVLTPYLDQEITTQPATSD